MRCVRTSVKKVADEGDDDLTSAWLVNCFTSGGCNGGTNNNGDKVAMDFCYNCLDAECKLSREGWQGSGNCADLCLGWVGRVTGCNTSASGCGSKYGSHSRINGSCGGWGGGGRSRCFC